MIRLAIAGCGLIGSRHAEAVNKHDRSELACLIEPDIEKTRDFDCPVVESIQDIQNSIDGVIIATPTHLHEEQAVDAMKRGWPVLIEKPIAGSVGEAQAIVDTSGETGLPVLVGHHRRHHPQVQALKKILDDGRVGDVLVVNFLWGLKKPDDYFVGNWRSSAEGSPILINTVHDIDLVRYLFGEIAEINGFGQSGLRGNQRVESAAFAMRLETGALVTVTVSDSTPAPWSFEAGTAENPNIAATGQDMLFVSGTRGAVSFPSLTVWSGSPDWSVAPTPEKSEPTSGVPLDIQLNHFLDVIEGKDTPIADAQEGLATLAATLKLEEIARSTALSV